jgi:hypothetical protein
VLKIGVPRFFIKTPRQRLGDSNRRQQKNYTTFLYDRILNPKHWLKSLVMHALDWRLWQRLFHSRGKYFVTI